MYAQLLNQIKSYPLVNLFIVNILLCNMYINSPNDIKTERLKLCSEVLIVDMIKRHVVQGLRKQIFVWR